MARRKQARKQKMVEEEDAHKAQNGHAKEPVAPTAILKAAQDHVKKIEEAELKYAEAEAKFEYRPIVLPAPGSTEWLAMIRRNPIFVVPKKPEILNLKLEDQKFSWQQEVWPQAQRGLLLNGTNFSEWQASIQSLVKERARRAHYEYEREVILGKRHENAAVNIHAYAVMLMLAHIDPYFLRNRVPIEKSMTTDGLLARLGKTARPFPIMNLPVELRRSIYSLMVPQGNVYEELVDCHPAPGDKLSRIGVVRRLCGVSQEFRNEISAIHYSSNAFMVQIFAGPEYWSKIWVQHVGLRHLQHLRDFRFSAEWAKATCDSFHVTFSPNNGLAAAIVQFVRYGGDVRLDAKVAIPHLEKIKKRKADEGWKTTGVIEFLTVDPVALRVMLGYGDKEFVYRRIKGNNGKYRTRQEKLWPW